MVEFGFAEDKNNSKLKEVFRDNVKLNEIHIDIYTENPLVTSSAQFMLMLRTIERNATVLNDNDRLVIRMNDRFKTYFMNVLFSEIKQCCYKVIDRCSFEFILNIQNLFYRITVYN